MAELAAHLTDHVLPHLPVRQWVLSVPKRLGAYLHHDPAVAGTVLGILLRAIRTTLRRTSPGASSEAQFGAVSFLHRFGSALNPHLHFHVVVLDGAFDQGPDVSARFHEAADLLPDHWLDLQRVVQRRVLRHFRARGLQAPALARRHGDMARQERGRLVCRRFFSCRARLEFPRLCGASQSRAPTASLT